MEKKKEFLKLYGKQLFEKLKQENCFVNLDS